MAAAGWTMPPAVEELDLWQTDLPELDGRMLESRYRLINGEDVDPVFASRWDELRARVDHLLGFDIWLFSLPMWNFGMPYRLKHFLDLVIQPTMAFTNDPSGAITCHGTGKTAVLVGAGALDTSPGTALSALDFCLPHLRQCLQVYFGITDIHAIRAMPTFGPMNEVDSAMAVARSEAEALALTLGARGDGPG